MARHGVDRQSIAQALEDIRGRTFGYWHGLQYGGLALNDLRRMCDDLHDHIAARTLDDPSLGDAHARQALEAGSEGAFGVLSLGCFPSGDFDISFPLADRELRSGEGVTFEDVVEFAPTTEHWLDAFAWAVTSGLVHERDRVLGLLLRSDYAPAIREGVPYSRLESTSSPAGLAEMNALCLYLTEASGHRPGDWPTTALRKPDAAERAAAARDLDAASASTPATPDQRLLRVLLDDDRPAFEAALTDRLVRLSTETPAAAPPRTLLPLLTIALTALAVQVHGWQLDLESHYLPESLIQTPGRPSRTS
ncbi:immunity 49 family protein [Streptomyces sp. NPDC087440]|uniref:immunity 49 family protein n=1 Tax=Streptomyces sp. NPDC087440 TaxID=3365790 RepID=UPI0038039806